MNLRGVVVSGDAMFAQRDLSIQIVRAKGDYLWTVKDHQEGLREDSEVLFQPQRKRVGTSALPTDFRTAGTVEKGHGHLEKRETASQETLWHTSQIPEKYQSCHLQTDCSESQNQWTGSSD